MSKFQRSYRIEIDLGNGTPPIVIRPPITINFTVSRRYQSSLNTLELSIFNLGKNLRDAIFQDFFDDRTRKSIRFFGGYDNLSLLYSGDIFEAYPMRQGTDVVVQIMAKDGIWDTQNSQTYQTLEKGQSIGDVLDFLISQFTNLQKGAVGEYPEILQRPVVLNGSTWELIKKYSDGRAFIDNGRVYVLKPDETITGIIPVIGKSSGLLETPRRTQGIIQAMTLFDTRLRIGELAELKSDISPVLNGTYQIIGLVHQGTISGGVGGNCNTIVDLLVGSTVFKTVQET